MNDVAMERGDCRSIRFAFAASLSPEEGIAGILRIDLYMLIEGAILGRHGIIVTLIRDVIEQLAD